jgi:hypothetical protein
MLPRKQFSESETEVSAGMEKSAGGTSPVKPLSLKSSTDRGERAALENTSSKEECNLLDDSSNVSKAVN